MTTLTHTTSSPTNLKLGLGITALLAFTDVAGLAGTGTPDAPPFPVIALGAVVGLITFGAIRGAWRQNTTALKVVIGSRTFSALSSLPPFFIDAPTWVRIACAVAITLTVLSVALLLPYVRRTDGS